MTALLSRSEPHVISLILRLFALRPFFTMAVFGIPLLTLIVVGLLTIMAFKALVFIVLPIAAVIWLIRRASPSSAS